MCYNYDVSITTFAIGSLATLYNIVSFGKNPLYLCISLFWMAAILMQLWEAMLWKDYNCNLFTTLAKYTNLAQPLLGMLVLLIPNYIKNKKIKLPLVALVIFFYLLTISPIIFSKNNSFKCIKKDSSIALKWWDMKKATVYVLAIVSLMKLLLPDKMFKYQAAFFLLGLLLANIIWLYQKYSNNPQITIDSILNRTSGRVGSIWCWVAAAAPFYNYYLFKNKF